MIVLEVRRFFRSAKVLTISGVVVLGIGVGSSALALSLLFAASSLVSTGMRHLGYATIAEPTGDGGSTPISWRDFEKARNLSDSVANIAAYSVPIGTHIEIDGRTHPFRVAAISKGFFSTFSEPLSAGQDFNVSEESSPANRSIILGMRSAVSLFGSPSGAIGRYVTIDGTQFETVGVAPPKFNGTLGDSVDAWVPAHSVVPLVMRIPEGDQADSGLWSVISSFYVVAASNHLSSATLSATLSQILKGARPNGLTLQASQGLTRDSRRDGKARKWLRLGVFLSFSLTIITCLNFSLLLLARAPRYLEEVRLKRALGARFNVLLIELIAGPAAMMLASLTVAGAICFGGLRAIAALPGFYGDTIRGSWQESLLAFAIQVPVACGLTALIALLPALGILRDTGVPQSGQASTTSRRGGFLVQLPVIAQIALCGCIWILSGMVVSGSLAVIRAPLGYEPASLKVVNLVPRENGVTFTSNGTNSFPSYSIIHQILESVSAVPGVRSASFSSDAPFEPRGYTVELQKPGDSSGYRAKAYEIRVSPDYFRTIGARIIRGRPVAWHGSLSSENEIVISELLARELWQGVNPVDRQVNIIYPAFAGIESFSSPAKIVGVAEDTRLSGPSGAADPTFFSSITASGFTVTSCVIVDGPIPLHALQKIIDAEVARLVPELKVSDSSKVWDDLQASLKPERDRLYFALCGAMIMGCLAYIGLYGALVYHVQVRRRELAIRICLGASQWAILRIILRRAVWSALAGVSLSAFLWPLLARLSSNDYLGRASWSTVRAILISLACVIVSLCVSFFPARSAASVSPSRALKEQ
jgi:predicted permease